MAEKFTYQSIRKNLAPHYKDEYKNTLEIEKFIKVEVLLSLFHYISPGQDVSGAYILLSGLNLIGRSKFSNDDYLMLNAKNYLKELRSKKTWEDWLNRYSKVVESIRLFYLGANNQLIIRETDNLPFSNRREAYINWLNTPYQKEAKTVKIATDMETYSFWNSDVPESITLPRLLSNGNAENEVKDKKGGNIVISYNELKNAAKEMDAILSSKPDADLRANWFESLNNVNFKAVTKGSVIPSEQIEIKEICNVVGMVGAGKSTAMNIITYWAANKGYRIVIILDTVTEVLKSIRFFNQLGINAVPLLGRYSRYEQLDKVAETEEMYLSEDYSKHLTAHCALDGFRNGNGDEAIKYGEEPCYNLKKKTSEEVSGENYVCPFYYDCPARKDERDLVNANIVVTTPSGLVYGRTPYPMLGKKMRFAEYALEAFDLVIFDESDRIQTIFDTTFCPTSSIDELLSANSGMLKEFLDAQGRRLDINKEERKFSYELMKLPDICDAVKELINNNKAVSEWEQIENGKSFSALVLLQDQDEIPEVLKNDIIKYIEENDCSKELNDAMMAIKSDATDEESEKLVYNYITKNCELTMEWKLRVQFILYLIVLEKRLRYVSDYGASGDEKSDSRRKIEGFLRNNFHELQEFLPASTVGNTFGFVYEREKKVLKTFRQFAFGRALMLKLPYLSLDKEGNAQGPHVLLLSGTSWAKGAAKYHIWEKVSYILEAKEEVRTKIEQAEVFHIPTDVRVSGSDFRNRTALLSEVIRQSEGYIKHELDTKPNGKILFIVNSYEEAKEAQLCLSRIFSGEKVTRMIKDDAISEENTIRRGEVWRFFKMSSRMLVTPAGAIERGHNIVDETGHSVLTSVFFLIRPMGIPGDIEEAVTRLNGMVSEYASNINPGSINEFERMKKLRHFATKRWGTSLGGSRSGLDYLRDYEKLDIAISRLVIIHQIFGRLARITDFERPAPSVYFADDAFKSKDDKGFDLLNQIMLWLKEQIEESFDKEIARTLYGPFYNACKRGLGLNE